MRNLVLRKAEKFGIEEGKKSGIKEGKLSIIQSLLNSGMKINEIVRITGLSQEEINNLLNNKHLHKNNNKK